MAPTRAGAASRLLVDQLSRSSSESSILGPSPPRHGNEAASATPEPPAQTEPLDDHQVPFAELLAQISKSKEPLRQEPERTWVPPQPRWDPGDTPFFVASSVSRCFEPQNAGFLPSRQFGHWDQERVFAPERTWPSNGKAAEFYDYQRDGLPDWKPGGWSGRTGEVFPFVPARERQAAETAHRRAASAKGRRSPAGNTAGTWADSAKPPTPSTAPSRGTVRPSAGVPTPPGSQRPASVAGAHPHRRQNAAPDALSSSAVGRQTPQRSLSSAPPTARARRRLEPPLAPPPAAPASPRAGPGRSSRPPSAGRGRSCTGSRGAFTRPAIVALEEDRR
uniref:Uncharacterized protein n=1 Tax=Alexandrium monilatum TaxID=311494 RepID=A0A7S4RML5_9DINO